MAVDKEIMLSRKFTHTWPSGYVSRAGHHRTPTVDTVTCLVRRYGVKM